MKKKQKELWIKIYDIALQICDYEPWNTIDKKAVLCCAGRNDNLYFYRFFGEKDGFFGLACYTNILDYLKVRHFDVHGNKKNEPALYMADAIIGIWDEPENISDKNIKLLKEIGVMSSDVFQSLHFEKYSERRLPQDISNKEAEILLDALENLFMMLKAVFTDGMKVDFSHGWSLLRFFSTERNLWLNFPCETKEVLANFTPDMLITNKAELKIIKKLPLSGLNIEADIRCLNIPIESDNTVFFPSLITLVDSASGYVIESELLHFDDSPENKLLSYLGSFCYNENRPKSVSVSDERVFNILQPFCKLTDIKLVKKKKLPQTEAAIKAFLKYYSNDMSKQFNEVTDKEFVCSTSEGRSKDTCTQADDEMKSYVISVSLGTGCYRHIRISEAALLDELSQAILDAFEFDNDHMHAFFMNNKKWTPGGYYHSAVFDENKFTDSFFVGEVLKERQNFVYIFDFGDEWEFKCRVLRIEDIDSPEPEVIRSVGDAPLQYGDESFLFADNDDSDLPF